MARPTSGQAWPRWSSGGSSSGGEFPATPPDVPNAFDDEFTVDPLDAKWTAILSASGNTKSPNLLGSWLANYGFGNATNTISTYRIRQAITGYNAGTAFTLYSRFNLSNYASGSAKVALLVGDNSSYRTGNYLELNAGTSGSNIVVEAYTGFSEATQTIPLGATQIYFAIRRKSSNVVYLYWSLDGIGWRLLWGDSTRNWNISYMWVTLEAGLANSTYESRVMCDFVRMDDSRLYLPSRT